MSSSETEYDVESLFQNPSCIRSSSTCCRLQRSRVRHRTPQIFGSQFETKVHNWTRKRVENYVENRSSHVRNPVFHEQICDELLSGFTMIARSGQAERNELLERGDTPEEGGRRVDCRCQTSLATSTSVIEGRNELHNAPTIASKDHIWASTPGAGPEFLLQSGASDRFRSQIAYIIIMKVVITTTNTNKK